MKQVTCKNCGAVYEDTLEKCPYCGTMNKKGSYKKFRDKIADKIDQLLGMKDEVNRSVSASILTSVFRSLILIFIVVFLAFFVSLGTNVNYNNDKEYDLETLEEIEWEEENLGKLEEAFENGDFDTIEKLYAKNSSAVSKWAHYPQFRITSEYQKIMEKDELDVSRLRDILYFLFYPDYFAGYNGMKKIDMEEYELQRESIITMMNQKGYTETKLEEIYRNCSDGYGYLSYSDLSAYMEGKNG